MTKKRRVTRSEDKTTNVDLGAVELVERGDEDSVEVTFGDGETTAAATKPGAQAGAEPAVGPVATPQTDPVAEEPMARPYEFSQDDDVEPTRQVQIFSERLAYWDAHDAGFSTADAEDELPLVLSMRKR